MSERPQLQGPDWVNSYDKRRQDLVLARRALVLASPVMGAAALAVRLSSGKPVIYSEARKGRTYREFPIYKFRTLPVGTNLAPDTFGPEDARATRVGKLLRKSTVDELPQLWNVLFGDMSFHGPRPILDADRQAVYAATRDSVDPAEHDFWWNHVRRNSKPGIIDDFSLIAHNLDHNTPEYFAKRVELETLYYTEASAQHDKALRRAAAKAVVSRLTSTFLGREMTSQDIEPATQEAA